jgi:hypothetical protein
MQVNVNTNFGTTKIDPKPLWVCCRSAKREKEARKTFRVRVCAQKM